MSELEQSLWVIAGGIWLLNLWLVIFFAISNGMDRAEYHSWLFREYGDKCPLVHRCRPMGPTKWLYDLAYKKRCIKLTHQHELDPDWWKR